jgi:hypothetical protein
MREDHLDHLGHLGLGERGTDAAAYTATEWKPGVGLGGTLEKALGAELISLGVEILAAMDKGYCRVGLGNVADRPAKFRRSGTGR